MIVLGAFLSALAIGFRSQAAVLTLPLLLVVLLQRAGRGAAGALLGSAMTFSIGVLVWAVPLVLATGGVAAYRAALAFQGGSKIFPAWTCCTVNPTPRRLALGLLQTFIYPWASTPLGCVVFALAAIGMLALLWRSRRAAILIITLALPYAVFHLLFQETVTTRYALPLIPVIAFLAVEGISADPSIRGRRVFPATRPTDKGRSLFHPASLAVAALSRLVAGADAAGGARATRARAASVRGHRGAASCAAARAQRRHRDASRHSALGRNPGFRRRHHPESAADARMARAGGVLARRPYRAGVVSAGSRADGHGADRPAQPPPARALCLELPAPGFHERRPPGHRRLDQNRFAAGLVRSKKAGTSRRKR